MRRRSIFRRRHEDDGYNVRAALAKAQPVTIKHPMVVTAQHLAIHGVTAVPGLVVH